MGLLTTAVLLAVFLFAGAKTQEPIFFFGAFVLLMWGALVCFARFVGWAVRLTTSPRKGQNTKVVNRPRPCPDVRCGRVNVAEARFCGQCGRRLA